MNLAYIPVGPDARRASPSTSPPALPNIFGGHLGGGRRRDLRRERGARLDHRRCSAGRATAGGMLRLAAAPSATSRRWSRPAQTAAATGAARRPGRRLEARLRRRGALLDPVGGARCWTSRWSRCRGRARPAHRPALRRCSTAHRRASSPSSRRRGRRTPASSTTSTTSPTPAQRARRVAARRRRLRRRRAGRAERPPPLRRHRARRQLHRRPAQVAVRAVRLLRAALPRARARPRGARAARRATSTQIDREAWNPSDLASTSSRRARGLPLWFSLATHGTDRVLATRSSGPSRPRARSPTYDPGDAGTCGCCSSPSCPSSSSTVPGWTEDEYRPGRRTGDRRADPLRADAVAGARRCCGSRS